MKQILNYLMPESNEKQLSPSFLMTVSDLELLDYVISCSLHKTTTNIFLDPYTIVERNVNLTTGQFVLFTTEILTNEDDWD